jgi:hypothetical protein
MHSDAGYSLINFLLLPYAGQLSLFTTFRSHELIFWIPLNSLLIMLQLALAA